MSNGQVRSEQDRPKTLIVVVALIVGVVTLIVIGAGLKEYYEFAIRDEITKEELAPVDARRLALTKLEQRHLTEYEWVDQTKGVVRIPIDRAMMLTIRDWNTLPAHLAPATAPAHPERSRGTPTPGAPSPERVIPAQPERSRGTKNGGTK